MLASAAIARAEPDPTAPGRREFELADQELTLGHYDRALEHLEASYRLTRKTGLLFNLAWVNRQLFERTRDLARLERAIDLFKTFLGNAQRDADPKLAELRERGVRELKSAEDALAREQAERARGEEALTVAERFLDEDRLAEAEEQLARYRQGRGNERAGVVRALRLRALLRAAVGDEPGAIDAFARALSLDRAVAPPANASDGARRAFLQAQLRLGDAPPVRVDHAPPGSLRPSAPVELSFAATPDPQHVVAGLQLHYRAGAGAFSSLPLQPVGRIQLPRTFAGALLPGAKIEYFADVLDEDGAVLQHLGTPALPFSVEVERQPSRPLVRKWWFWTATVAAVAAVALGVGLGVGLSEPPRAQVHIVTGRVGE